MNPQNLLLSLLCFFCFIQINVFGQCEAEAGELSSLTIDTINIDGEELFEIQVNMFGYNADTAYHHFYLLIPYFDPATGQTQTTIQQISLDGNFIVEDPSLHSIMAISLLAAQLPIPIEDIGILKLNQAGIESPSRPRGGLISSREERIVHFQNYIRKATSQNATACVETN